MSRVPYYRRSLRDTGTAASQLSYFDAPPPPAIRPDPEPAPEMAHVAPHFSGKTYDPALDAERLTKQQGRVYAAFSEHGIWSGWFTLAHLQEAILRMTNGTHRDPEASISRRFRNLRDAQFGGYRMERKRLSGGLWVYRMNGRLADEIPEHRLDEDAQE